jgi:hypothetical protein
VFDLPFEVEGVRVGTSQVHALVILDQVLSALSRDTRHGLIRHRIVILILLILELLLFTHHILDHPVLIVQLIVSVPVLNVH